MIRLKLGIAFLLITTLPALAQEQSVNPGINDNFKDPNVDYYINLFEGESREIFKFRNEIVSAMSLKPGDIVADVGAGTGFFARMFSYQVAPGGSVYAVDIAQKFVDHIKKMAANENITNITARLCSDRSVDLPADSIDVAFICDVYHHFEYPFDSMASIHTALRPGGRVFIVDFERIKGVSTDFVMNHVRCGKGTVTDEVKDSGFDLVREIDLGMDGQYMLEFVKRAPADGR